MYFMFNFGKTQEEEASLSAMDENFAIISFKPDGTILNANEKEFVGKDSVKSRYVNNSNHNRDY